MNDSPTSSTPHFPKGRYAALMAPACAAAAVGAWLVARMMGGDTSTQTLAAACVAAASVVTFLPALLAGNTRGGGTNFGVLVLAASMSRTLMLLVLALVMSETRELASRPFWIGILAGGGLVLIVESSLAVMFLARLERQRTADPVARS